MRLEALGLHPALSIVINTVRGVALTLSLKRKMLSKQHHAFVVTVSAVKVDLWDAELFATVSITKPIWYSDNRHQPTPMNSPQYYVLHFIDCELNELSAILCAAFHRLRIISKSWKTCSRNNRLVFWSFHHHHHHHYYYYCYYWHSECVCVCVCVIFLSFTVRRIIIVIYSSDWIQRTSSQRERMHSLKRSICSSP